MRILLACFALLVAAFFGLFFSLGLLLICLGKAGSLVDGYGWGRLIVTQSAMFVLTVVFLGLGLALWGRDRPDPPA